MRPLEFVPAITDAPRLDSDKHLLSVAAGSPRPVETPENAATGFLARLEEQLHADGEVHAVILTKLPPLIVLQDTPTLQDRVTAARRKLSEMRVNVHIADTAAVRAVVQSLQSKL